MDNNETAYSQLSRYIVFAPRLNLNANEVCYFQDTAYGFRDKNVVTGYSGGGSGVSVRVAKGVSVHTGGSARKAIRETVTEYSKGTLYLTNQRVILLSQKYGFELSVKDILSTQANKKRFTFYSKGKSYSVEVTNYKMVEVILNLIYNVFLEQQDGIPRPINIPQSENNLFGTNNKRRRKKWKDLDKKEKNKRIIIIVSIIAAFLILVIIGAILPDNDAAAENMPPISHFCMANYE